MSTSPALRALLEELRDPSALAPTQETYDLAEGRSLDPADREAYAIELSKQIAHQDSRAALTAAELGLRSTVPALQAAATADGWFGLSVRRALAELGEGAAIIPLLVKDLDDAGFMHRFGTVMALGLAGRGRQPAAVEALLKALGDEDQTVRAQAFKSLMQALEIEKYGRNEAEDDVELRSPLQRLDLLLGAKLTSLREPARAELARIAHGIVAGKTPESLGLPYVESVPRDVMLRLGRSLFNPAADLPLRELETLTGADRAYAESLIAKSLDREVERAPAALAALQATWTLPALQEAAATSSDAAFKQAVEAAIRQLESN